MAVRGTILVIEDDEDIAELLANRLRRQGFNLVFANDGKKGLDQTRSSRPDLIILDLMLPLVPGEVICKEIREDADPRISGIPMIMLTAKGSHMDKMIGQAIGANVYIHKPFDADDLISEINRLLEKTAGR